MKPGSLVTPCFAYGFNRLGIVTSPPNDASIIEIYWICDNDVLPRYLHVEEVELVSTTGRTEKNDNGHIKLLHTRC